MSETLVIVLRAISLLTFAALRLLGFRGRSQAPSTRSGQRRGDRVPVLVNVTAFAWFFLSLLTFPGTLEGYAALLLAMTGCPLALAGSTLVLRSRMELGAAWNFVPVADEVTGLVTIGPHRFIRHLIYLGLSMLALGQALAFASWPAPPCRDFPNVVWRALAREKVLTAVFGERYVLYRTHTKMIIPRLL